MRDQADKLRELALNFKNRIEDEIVSEQKKTKVIAITSGKGGVGKSTLSLNLSITLSQMKKKVVLMDADLGLANIDIMLGIIPKYNLLHLIRDEKALKDIIVKVNSNFDIIPGGSGINELANLKEGQLRRIMHELSKLERDYDILIIDTGAGISNRVISFLLSADEIIVITTPEPTSLTDAYGVVKSVSKYNYNGKINLVVNRANNETEAMMVGDKFRLIVNKFLEREIYNLGIMIKDPQVEEGIKLQKAFVEVFPKSRATQSIRTIANNLIYAMDEKQIEKDRSTGIRAFFKKMIGR